MKNNKHIIDKLGLSRAARSNEYDYSIYFMLGSIEWRLAKEWCVYSVKRDVNGEWEEYYRSKDLDEVLDYLIVWKVINS